jgi:SAM-dependent methyltransferase
VTANQTFQQDQPRRIVENYRSADNLKARISIYDYRIPQIDPVDIAMGLLPSDLGLVLDIGCGHGRYVKRLRENHPKATVVGIDQGAGMLAEVPPPAMVADIQAVPYPDDSADAVLAMHMLYHVPDIAKAVNECRRVLKPGGTFLASTNIAGDMDEMFQVWEASIAEVLGAIPGAEANHVRQTDFFNSANAPGYLEAEFDSVERFDDRGLVSVPHPQPLIDFFTSIRSFIDCTDEVFAEIHAAVTRRFEAHFATHETFDFEKVLVMYRCR